MSPKLFVILSLIINTVLSIFVLFRNYKHNIFIPLISTGILLPVTFYYGIDTVVQSAYSPNVNLSFFFLLSLVCAVSLLFLNNIFMQKTRLVIFQFKNFKISRGLLILIVSFIHILLLIFFRIDYDPSSLIITSNSTILSFFLFILIGLHLYSTYLLENTFRFSKEYQRRIARLFFIPMTLLLIFHIFFFTTIFLYKNIFISLLQIGLVIQGITYPVILLGFFRYRLGHEQVTIPRNTVYSSFSLFLAGAVFLGIGLSMYLFRILHLDFEYFETVLIIFTFTFLLFLVVSSGEMRRRIILFVNRNFYSSKYDYRDQFFRLHQTHMHTDGLNESIINLVENMKYAVAANDAFVFLKEPHSYSYVLKKNPEFLINEQMIIPGNDPVIAAFENNLEPINLITNDNKKRTHAVFSPVNVNIRRLSTSIIFPIPYNNSLAGLLLINTGDRVLDSEDIAFIKVFSEAIGYTYYKENLLQTTIENSQFQSFNQVVSFVVHDIKNQIATLSLLAKNADQYIANTDFQQSLIRSIRSCSENLTNLVEKLSSKRKGIDFTIESQPVLPILEKIVNSSIVNSNDQIQIEWIRKESCYAKIDRSALEQIFLNLIKNGIESMNYKGRMKLYCFTADNDYPEFMNRFNLPQSTLRSKKAVIIIEDTGCGMDRDFLETRLFKPFETTKDKGMGIGLYQCKTYIEKMDGRLLCDSHLNKGTAFCILF